VKGATCCLQGVLSDAVALEEDAEVAPSNTPVVPDLESPPLQVPDALQPDVSLYGTNMQISSQQDTQACQQEGNAAEAPARDDPGLKVREGCPSCCRLQM
jgi:hypothetical protein